MLTMLNDVHEWEIMSQIPPELFQRLIVLRKFVFDYNYYIERDTTLFDRWNNNSILRALEADANTISTMAKDLSARFATLAKPSPQNTPAT